MKRRKIISFSLLALFLFAIIPLQRVTTSVLEEDKGFNQNAYVSHVPINITNDADFGNTGYNFSGEGSQAFPYLIENLNITVGSGNGIAIETTSVTVYFEIKNCYIRAECPIYLSDLGSNLVIIQNNTLEVINSGYKVGIYVYGTHHVDIIGNRLYGLASAGIYSENSYYNLVQGNYFNGFTNALDIWDCYNWDIFDNYFTYNDGDQYVSVENFVFYNNTWFYNNNGLYLGNSLDCNVTGNYFIDNNYYAVTLYMTTGTYVYLNWFINNNAVSSQPTQASDTDGGNYWSWAFIEKGNFWSDYSTEGDYWIFGDRYDVYPIWDSDNDGLNEYDEVFVYGTDEFDSDSDDDLLPDGYEVEQGLNPLYDDAKLDPDSDGLINLDEYKFGTLCQDWDTDGDAMSDGYEVFHSLNPLFDDASLDFDGDGLTNLQEYNLGTKANNFDSDMDGMSDYWETENGLNPLVNDAWMDLDDDGLNNFLEYIYGCDPNDEDSDNDSYKDGEEILQGTNPNDSEDYPSTTNQSTTTESTYYWIGGLFALVAVSGLPIIIQRIRLNKLRELVKEYFPRMKF